MEEKGAKVVDGLRVFGALGFLLVLSLWAQCTCNLRSKGTGPDHIRFIHIYRFRCVLLVFLERLTRHLPTSTWIMYDLIYERHRSYAIINRWLRVIQSLVNLGT